MAQCKAMAHRTGERCQRPATRGTTVCVVHGAGSPKVKAAAARRVKEQAAAEAVVQYGLPVDIEPAEALVLEVQRTQGAVQWLEQKVRGLSDQSMVVTVDQKTTHGGAGTKKSVNVRAGASVWLELYDRERKHLAAVTSAALKAGVEERQLALQEREAGLLVGVVDEILDGLGLDEDQLETAASIVPSALRRADEGEPYQRPARQASPRPSRSKVAQLAAEDALRRAGADLDDPRARWAVDAAVASVSGGTVPEPPRAAVAELGPAASVADVGEQIVAAVDGEDVDVGGHDGVAVDLGPDVEVVDAELVDEQAPEPAPEPERPVSSRGASPRHPMRDPAVSRPFVDPQAPGQRGGWGARR